MEHFDGVNNQERYNNDLLNEIRKTNQLLEKLISHKETKPESKPRSDQRATSRQQQVRSNSRNTK